MYEDKLFSFDSKIKKDITLIAKYDDICHVEGHHFKDADCTNAKVCVICGVAEGNAVGHTWIEATYQSPKTCAECGETLGTKLFYNPVALAYEMDITSTYLTLSEYENLKEHLKVFAILKDGERVELSNEDIVVTSRYQTHLETRMSANYIELTYNNMTICTSKMLLGLFENAPFDLEGLDIEKDSSFISSENIAQCRINHNTLEQDLINQGYASVHDYLLDLGWEMPGFSKQYNSLTELVYVPILYYVKDGCCLYIDQLNNLDSTTGEFVDLIQISTIPDVFYENRLDEAISSNLEKLYFLTSDITHYTIQEGEQTLLHLLGKGYTVYLSSFSNLEKDMLISKIEALCAHKNQTYPVDGTAYMYYQYKEGIDMIISVHSTSDAYADITITYIEIK